MVVHPEVSQLLHDVGPVLGRIWVVKLYSSHGTQHAAPEQPSKMQVLSLSFFFLDFFSSANEGAQPDQKIKNQIWNTGGC